jgi:basic membrane protein A
MIFMISKWFTRGLVLTSFFVLFLFHSGASVAQTLKVALVLPGPVSDKGFNASAHKGLMLVKKNLGDKVEVAFSESVQRPDFVSSLRDYANRGYDVIYAHGFQWGDAIAKVAAENPKKYFFNIYGIGKGANLANLHVNNEALFHVLGQVAARISKANVVGAVGGWEIPPIRIQVDSFKKGVLKANPSAKVSTIFTGTFYDAVKGKEAARALISQGADVIAHMADSTGLGVIQAASEANVITMGYFGDQQSVAPKSVATSAVIKTDEMFWQSLQSVINKKFKSGFNNFGFKSGILKLGTYGPMVPENVKKEISALIADITSGKVVIPRANVPALMKAKINKL